MLCHRSMFKCWVNLPSDSLVWRIANFEIATLIFQKNEVNNNHRNLVCEWTFVLFLYKIAYFPRSLIKFKNQIPKKMKILSVLLSVLAAGPLNDRSTIVQKSCQITCSGKTNNFMEYEPSILHLQGKYRWSLLPIIHRP